MARRRFFVDWVANGAAELTGEDARHLALVLRAEPGQRYEVSDNHAAYLAEITSVTRNKVGFRILEDIPGEGVVVPVTLVLSLIKFDRLEWIIEKATELGVARILLAEAGRSEKGLLAASVKRIERWRRILREAGQQSRRVSLPEITGARPLGEVLAGPFPSGAYLDERPGATPLLTHAVRNRCSEMSIAVGPVGGWTEADLEILTRHGWVSLSLGPRILRTETAAIAAIAVLAHGIWAQSAPPPIR